jgi:hypothetical protein
MVIGAPVRWHQPDKVRRHCGAGRESIRNENGEVNPARHTMSELLALPFEISRFSDLNQIPAARALHGGRREYCVLQGLFWL